MTLMSESKEKRTAQPAGVSHMKVFMQDFVLDIVRSFLQGDEVPLSWKLFLDSVVSTSTRPRIPVVNTQSPLHRRGRRKYLLTPYHKEEEVSILSKASRKSAAIL